MFIVGSKVKIVASNVSYGVGPYVGSTGYVGKISTIFLPTFGFTQEFTIFFDRFGKKSAGSRCERKRVLNIIADADIPEKSIKAIQSQSKEIDKLIVATTDREDAVGLPKVLVVPAKQTNLATATILEKMCWVKSVLYEEENKHSILDWLSSKKGPKVMKDADNVLLENLNGFMLLSRHDQMQLLQEKFPQIIRTYRMVVAASEVKAPMQLEKIKQGGQILNKLWGNGLLLKTSFDELSYKGLLLQFCCSPQIYKCIKDTTDSIITVSNRSTNKVIAEVDQWKEALTMLN